jgi:tetratricopeptide (TPR) repeat protein
VKIDGQAPGSGVLVARQGQTYYVLTAAHVVPSPDEYDVVTPDGKQHRLDFNQIKRLPNTDLALIPFNSPQTYTVATLGSSSQVTTNTPAFVSGFPSMPAGSTGASTYRFSDGVIEAQSTRPLSGGYALAYYNFTFSGMSGGPIFDQQGKLIGIHGASKTRFAASQGVDPSLGQKVGINLGIPIDTFLRLAPQAAPGVTLPAAPPAKPVAQPTAADFYLQGAQLAIEGKTQEALAPLNQSIKLKSDFAEAYAERGALYLDLNNYEAALADFNQAIRLNPKGWNYYNNRGIAKFNLKDLQGAIADYSQSIQLKPTSAISYYNRGNIYSRLGNSAKAIADYTQAIQVNPNYANAYRNRGNVKNSSGQSQAALADYDQSIKLDPTDGLTYAGRGSARTSLQDLAGALSDFNLAIKANPKLFIAYTGRGLVYNMMKQPDAAIADYTEAIRLNPQDGTGVVYLSRGVGRNQIKDYQGALTDFNQAIKLNPSSGQAYYYRALTHGILGNQANTLSDLRRAAELARQQNNPSLLQAATNLLQKLER